MSREHVDGKKVNARVPRRQKVYPAFTQHACVRVASPSRGSALSPSTMCHGHLALTLTPTLNPNPDPNPNFVPKHYVPQTCEGREGTKIRKHVIYLNSVHRYVEDGGGQTNDKEHVDFICIVYGLVGLGLH